MFKFKNHFTHSFSTHIRIYHKMVSISFLRNLVNYVKIIKKSGSALPRGDIGRIIDWQATRSQRLVSLNAYRKRQLSVARHKTSRREGCSLTFLTDWLMTPSSLAL